MKHILAELFPYIVILYLVDCVTYIRTRHLQFISNLGETFKIKQAGLYLAGIWPIGQAFISHNIPVCFTRRGVYFLKDENLFKKSPWKEEEFDFVAYHDMVSVETEGKMLKINGRVAVRAPSSLTATRLMKFILDLKQAQPSNRNDKIQRFLTETTNLHKIKSLDTACPHLCSSLNMLSCTLFAYAFILLPLVLYSEPHLYTNIFPLLLFMALNYLSIFILAYFVHRKIYLDGSGWTNTLVSMILSPITAVHALRNVTRDMYAQFDHVALAARLCSKSTFVRVMRSELELIACAKAADSHKDLAEFWKLKEGCLHSLLDQMGMTVEEVLSPPAKIDRSAFTYCPFCQTEYRFGFKTCGDCGASLKPFEKTSSVSVQ